MLPHGGRLRCTKERLLNGIAFIHIWQVTVFSVDALHVNMLNISTVKTRPIEIDKCIKLKVVHLSRWSSVHREHVVGVSRWKLCWLQKRCLAVTDGVFSGLGFAVSCRTNTASNTDWINVSSSCICHFFHSSSVVSFRLFSPFTFSPLYIFSFLVCSDPFSSVLICSLLFPSFCYFLFSSLLF